MEAYNWVKVEGNSLPSNSVVAGKEGGSTIYAARVATETEILPAKAIPDLGGAFYSNDGKEISTFVYEVLVGPPVSWRLNSKGEFYSNSIPVGKTAKNETLFMGKVLIGESLTPGKIHPSHKKLYAAYGGKEMTFEEYEVMNYPCI